MTLPDEPQPADGSAPDAARPMRLPGFIQDGEVGLGDLVKRTAGHLGIKPCGGCERRAQVLNGWLVRGLA